MRRNKVQVLMVATIGPIILSEAAPKATSLRYARFDASTWYENLLGTILLWFQMYFETAETVDCWVGIIANPYTLELPIGFELLESHAKGRDQNTISNHR